MATVVELRKRMKLSQSKFSAYFDSESMTGSMEGVLRHLM